MAGDLSARDATPPARAPTSVIDGSRRWDALDARALWAHRDLLTLFVLRDVKLRYRQTLIGVGWAILQPTLTMVVFTFLFDRLAGLPSDRRPYPVFSYAALVPWMFFATSLGRVSSSIVVHGHLIRKVYFPRLLIPVSALGAGLLDFFFAMLVMVGLLWWYRVSPSPWAVVHVPLLALLTAATALGVGLWLAAINVRYRDVGYALPFVIQLWLFVTPVIYPTTLTVKWLERRGLPGWLTGLNPMAGVVEGFRSALLGVETPQGGSVILTSCVVSVSILVTGLVYFARAEDAFADEI